MKEVRVITPAWETEVDANDFVHTNGKYTNLVLNTYQGKAGIAPGQFITVNKHPEYGEPRTFQKQGQYGPYNMHSATVIVGDKEASFVTFSDEEAAAFTAFDVGSTIQISKEEFSYVDAKGTKRIKERLVFRAA